MRKKKLLILIASVLAVVALLCVGVLVTIDYLQKNGFYQQSETVDQTKALKIHSDLASVIAENNSFIKPAENGAELNYKETVNYSDSVKMDVYADSYKNEYTYNADGVLMEFRANEEDIALAFDKLTDISVSEKEASALAQKYASCFFGNRIDGFELQGINYNQDGKTYSVTLAKKYGEGDFIIGAWCFVDVLTDGSVTGCTLSNEDLAEKVGEDKLDAISEKTVTDYVKTLVSKDYPECTGYEIESVSLVEKDNKYSLLALTRVSTGTAQAPLNVGAEYYYDI